jgi:alpha-D-ribose 1-methylphosphonate 5-triphosphate diphosphatase
MKTYITNARLILADEILEDASILLEDDIIASINPETTPNTQTINLTGKTLAPGLIDCHCDAIEREIEPRPGVPFPLPFALAQIDQRNAMAGITTTFHAISFANDVGIRSPDVGAEIVRAIHAYQPHALVEHRVHCRYEITYIVGLHVLLDLLTNDLVHLISLMDHTPGQGQFKDLQSYKDYIVRNYHKTSVEAEAMAIQKKQNTAGAIERVKRLIAEAHQRRVPIASHDDDTPERIRTMADMGVKLSEFPINLETAKAAKAAGLGTILGAPNILRGESQSGSMKAIDAIHNNAASCLCSDYVPGTLLAAIFLIPQISAWSLPQAVNLATNNPAQTLGLHDRGEIAVGKRADLLAVHVVNGWPQVVTTWVAGKVVYHCGFNGN